MAPLICILGGARSGKSRHAERLIADYAPPWTYLATAEALDDEMRARIAEHRGRRDERWRTIEPPHALAEAVREATGRSTAPYRLPDALPTPSHRRSRSRSRAADAHKVIHRPLRRDNRRLERDRLGIVPDDALARRFRDIAGKQPEARRARRPRRLYCRGPALSVEIGTRRLVHCTLASWIFG